MQITFQALPSDVARDLRATERDAYDNPLERHISTGGVYPCRHCLGEIPKGRPYIILAHRPFTKTHAYTETGPIFLCADDCTRAPENDQTPAILRAKHFILRAYDTDERIIYGTGSVVPTPEIPMRARTLLEDTGVAFVDIRSAANNCYQCRVVRA